MRREHADGVRPARPGGSPSNVLSSGLALGCLVFGCGSESPSLVVTAPSAVGAQHAEEHLEPAFEATTRVLTWPGGKRGAVSLTYDDGTITHFRVALPLMEERGLPATFFIVTGDVPAAEHRARFIGRDIATIVSETEHRATNEENFFERATAIRFAGKQDAKSIQDAIGAAYEQGKIEDAYRLVDEAYAKLRKGGPLVEGEPSQQGAPSHNGGTSEAAAAATESRYVPSSWSELRDIGSRGYEFASHTVSHPYLSVLDEPNLLYEIEKSKQEILTRLGPEHTFSIECPYGTENPRVMSYALPRYRASRNRMPAPYLDELNRWDERNPLHSSADYVQWQRGPHSDTPLETVREWVDTTAEGDNVWLVLVFHGVDGVGWEPKPASELAAYFDHIKSLDDALWVATFRDVTKYMRERMHARVTATTASESITIEATHTLDADVYDYPLTLKTYVPGSWKNIEITSGNAVTRAASERDEVGTYVVYPIVPNQGLAHLRAVH